MALVTVQRSPTPSTSSSPCVSESGSGEEDRRSQPRSISESFLTVKGAAVFLPRGNGSTPSSASRFSQLRSKHAGDLQQHLQTMFTVLRPEDNIKLAVRLESSHPQVTRYMVVVSTNGRQDTEESLVLGMDFCPPESLTCSVGLVLPLWSDTRIHLDGDGGFSVSTETRVHVFKPVSVQAMWSALQSLHKACEVARCHNYFPGSLFLTWVSYYQSQVSSDQFRINEWNAMQDVQSHRADSPNLFSDVPTERERTERLIKNSLKEIMMQKDLENVTSKEIRTELEMSMTCNLREFKEYIDNEMIVILGQMDSPTEIFEHVYLGSEWNASNLEELQNSGVQYILNVTREIDNFFPGLFEYHNIRVYDEEATDLLAYWNETYKFISRAKKAGAKCLVHCKMGVSRSASTVIAYAMKEYGWDLERAFRYVKELRAVTKPNPSFMKQLEEYQGILLASKQRHNKLWRSHSDSDLSEHHEPLSKPSAHSLGPSDPHNQASSTAPTLEELLQPPGPSALGAAGPSQSTSLPDTGTLDACRTARPPAPRPRGAPLPPCGTPPAPSAGPASPPLPHADGPLAPEEDPAGPPAEDPAGPPAEDPAGPPAEDPAGPPAEDPAGPPGEDPAGPLALLPPELSAAAVHERPPAPPSVQRLPPAAALSAEAPERPLEAPPLAPGRRGAEVPDEASPGRARRLSGLPSENGTPAPADATTDHINFFSAREKFQGLSQDGKPLGQSKGPLKDGQGPPLEEGPGDGQREREEGRKDDPLRVQIIELKPTPPVSQSERPGQQDEGSEREAAEEAPSAPAKEKESASDAPAPSKEEEGEEPDGAPLCRDWTRGSVKRVTRQLEQRMKREQDPPSAAPPPPPGSSCTRRRSQLPPPSPPEDPPNGGPDPPSSPLDPVAGGFQEAGVEVQREVDRTERPPLSTSSPPSPRHHHHHHQPSLLYSSPPPLSSVDFLCLEGVTEQDSSDWDRPADGMVMRGTWATLRELGAFLQQVSANKWGRGVEQRVREVEAKIRQAGLTPPSLMKRSASLAKLGCLELLANELSEWDPRADSAAAAAAPSVADPPPLHGGSDESKKKQRVQGYTSSGPLPPAPTPAPLRPLGLIAMATRQQYGRTQPLRRLKRRSVSNLYHTM
ncbi:protein phosphatase Slingshot homolog 2b [Gadus chalcogrammus]|uniref:protein phosphatase Slingshot homolog 2b n=1 Tax=Gadus chalcogrammus TaxID=1042646 RepID=UPI0024C3BEE5|nr:protein phosphatase Slingshot homolog 2b [Gadus chalcogrammus]